MGGMRFRLIAMNTFKKAMIVLMLLCLALGPAGCAPAPKPKTTVVVFAAGSLIIPFDALEKAFEAKNPDIDIQAEYHGSIQVIRHCTELKEKIDVIATADQALIPMLMMQTVDAGSGKPYADWYLHFATNRLGLAYTEKSRYAGEINADNWTEILSRPDVRVGIADPRFDASGYRALMVLYLAQSVYDNPNLFTSLFAGQFRYPIKLEDTPPAGLIRVPEVLESKSGSHIITRGASVQLLALLESGDLDYAFEYQSVIEQHSFKEVVLPDSLNLGVAEQNPFYSNVTVLLDFQRFASVKPEFKGEQIGYGITIPTNAPHPAEAERFIAFLLSPEGRSLMENDHHPLFTTIIAQGYAAVPASLKALSTPAP